MTLTWILNFVLSFAPEWVRKVVMSAVASYTKFKLLPATDGGVSRVLPPNEMLSEGDPGYVTDPSGAVFEMRLHAKRIK